MGASSDDALAALVYDHAQQEDRALIRCNTPQQFVSSSVSHGILAASSINPAGQTMEAPSNAERNDGSACHSVTVQDPSFDWTTFDCTTLDWPGWLCEELPDWSLFCEGDSNMANPGVDSVETDTTEIQSEKAVENDKHLVESEISSHNAAVGTHSLKRGSDVMDQESGSSEHDLSSETDSIATSAEKRSTKVACGM